MNTAKNSLRDLLQGTVSLSEAENSEQTIAGIAPKSLGNNAHSVADDKRNILMEGLFKQSAPLYLTDPSGHIVVSSPSFCELAPLFFKTIEGEKAWDVNDTPPGLMEIIERLYIDKRELQRSDVIETGDKDEKRFFVSRHFPINDGDNELIGFGGIYEDVTSLVKARKEVTEIEGWLQDTIRSSSDWLWAVDHNFNLTSITPRISEILDTPAQVIQGRHLFALGGFDPEDRISAGTKEDMDNFRPFRNRIFLMHTKNGEPRYVHMSGIPVFNEISGRFEGYRGTGTDFTQHIKKEKLDRDAQLELQKALVSFRERNEELAVALNQSQVADRAKTDFLAMMSHELRTPLNCIIGFSDAAMQRIHGPLDSSYVDYFSSIHEAGTHLLGIISDILDTANIENSDVSIETTSVHIRDLIEESTSMVRPKANGKNLSIVIGDFPQNLEAETDQLRARQIMVNLLGNAIKFTPDAGSIGIDVTSPNEDQIALSVWDTGIGIPESEKEHIFDRFYQVEKNILARGIEGTGLGLNISRHLARLMGGDLVVDSADKGARFTFLLPVTSKTATEN